MVSLSDTRSYAHKYIKVLANGIPNFFEFQVKTGSITHIDTVAVVLRCLSQAPRLPTLDWGAIIRRCMRYESQVAEQDSDFKTGSLREECLNFTLAHANQFDPLLSFLDELFDLSRFRMLELNLQSCLFIHLAEVMKLFSASRLEKLFKDVAVFLSSASFSQVHDSDQKTMLRNSCWKGIYMCLDEASLESLEYTCHIEMCMEVLFSFLPSLQYADSTGLDQRNSIEWSEAVRCLGKARKIWLSNFLQVYNMLCLCTCLCCSSSFNNFSFLFHCLTNRIG